MVAAKPGSLLGVTLMKRQRDESEGDEVHEVRRNNEEEQIKRQRVGIEVPEMCTIVGCAMPVSLGSALCTTHYNNTNANAGNHQAPVSTANTGALPTPAKPLSMLLEDLLQPNSFNFTPVQSPASALVEKESPSKAKSRRCISPDCPKSAQGKTNFCKAHGGGRRCQIAGCTRAARGSTAHCIAHGGGKRCNKDGCDKSAVGATPFCVKHGGGRRCMAANCAKSARGGTTFCARHNTIERKRLALEQQQQQQQLQQHSRIATLSTVAQLPSLNQQPTVPISPMSLLGPSLQPLSPSTMLLASMTSSLQRLQNQKKQEEQQRQLMNFLQSFTSPSASNSPQISPQAKTWKF